MTGEVKAVQSQDTVKIGGVQFIRDEVQGVNKTGEGINSVYTVQTTFGRFEFSTYKGLSVDSHKNPRGNEGVPSIMTGNLNNVYVHTYTGTKNQDVLHLSNSAITDTKLKGDPGNNDAIYCENDSWVNGSGGGKFDVDDKIWYRQ